MDELVLVPPRTATTSEADIQLGPQRATRLVDAGLGGEAETAITGQVEMLRVGLVEQVIHPDTARHLGTEAVGRIDRQHTETGRIAKVPAGDVTLAIRRAA